MSLGLPGRYVNHYSGQGGTDPLAHSERRPSLAGLAGDDGAPARPDRPRPASGFGPVRRRLHGAGQSLRGRRPPGSHERAGRSAQLVQEPPLPPAGSDASPGVGASAKSARQTPAVRSPCSGRAAWPQSSGPLPSISPACAVTSSTSSTRSRSASFRPSPNSSPATFAPRADAGRPSKNRAPRCHVASAHQTPERSRSKSGRSTTGSGPLAARRHSTLPPTHPVTTFSGGNSAYLKGATLQRVSDREDVRIGGSQPTRRTSARCSPIPSIVSAPAV